VNPKFFFGATACALASLTFAAPGFAETPPTAAPMQASAEPAAPPPTATQEPLTATQEGPRFATQEPSQAALQTSLLMATQEPSQTPTQPSSPLPRPKETDAAHRGDGVHVGVLGGVGFPRPLVLEGLLEFDHLLVLGVEYSALPTTTFYGVQTSLWALAADARVFPFRNAFFVGLRAGKQHLSVMASLTEGGATFSGSNTADTTFINPCLGFLWNWHALAIGIDAGVQIPLLSTSSSTLPAGVSAPSGVTDVTRLLGQGVLPTVDLLRIGVVM
jgi:hypothetical protein